MGVHVITVPDVGEGIAEVELVSWAVAVGQTVARNQVLAEVMTDKANVEIPSPVDGVISALTGEVGGILAVGSELIELTVEGAGNDGGGADGAPARPSPPGDDVQVTLSVVANGNGNGDGDDDDRDGDGSGSGNVGAPAAVPTAATPATAAANAAPALAARGRAGSADGAARQRPILPRAEGEKPLASPAVRHRARQAGIDLRLVRGTGPAGRITHDDLDALSLDDMAPSPTAGTGRRGPDARVDVEPIVGIRRQIAKRMVASTQTIPHITYVEEVDVTAVEALRATLNAERQADGPRLTLLPFVVLAMVEAIARFPQMNAHVDDDGQTLTTYGGVHVGIATQTPNGLVVPVIRHTEAASMWELAARISASAEAARTGRAAPADLSGSTITITSLGPLGGLVTTPVINKPEVAIVGINKMVERPVVRDGAVVVRTMMNLSSSFDHRIIDGWDAASFVQRIRRSLEQPALLFIDDATGLDGGAPT